MCNCNFLSRRAKIAGAHHRRNHHHRNKCTVRKAQRAQSRTRARTTCQCLLCKKNISKLDCYCRFVYSNKAQKHRVRGKTKFNWTVLALYGSVGVRSVVTHTSQLIRLVVVWQPIYEDDELMSLRKFMKVHERKRKQTSLIHSKGAGGSMLATQ